MKDETNPYLDVEASKKSSTVSKYGDMGELRRAQWREENTATIQAYNEHVEEYGTFSDSIRKF